MSAARELEERAARWLIRREEPDWTSKDQADLDAWLAESMAHKAAYWRLEYGWRQADRIASLGVSEPSDQYSPSSRGRWIPAAVAAALVAVIGTGVLTLNRPPAGLPAVSEKPAVVARLDTPVGGRRVVPLADGSKVELNTATVLRSAVDNARREVWLEQGEAYFEVAHNAKEPFVVHAGDKTVTVLGTKFSVRRQGDTVTVAVVEGRVRVDDAAATSEAARSTIITGGDMAISAGPSTLLAPRNAERVERQLAWRDGMLRFDRTTLGDAAAEFNRYNKKQLTVADSAAGIEIGGTFEATNVDAFVRLLRDAYGLKVREEQGGAIISS